ncbi:prepilin-type N-terminal cleavage/methylation domain-containing protein [Siminovitchia acidinfaciens]|uniref:Prepilin-type N-terminal cleavage/methylation domain-containing protein n=1 Tax=Siminovitchia acidinfaciens TaxID=2321395 RepID=A0A429XYJ2_9BACI|nr:competence type IV pilus minor pilin ComGF [Siminovitchia acidinfaciens]RST73806.1 prepilin-type N-terminal cleavage/methylation domain-containing protein [Siminovitchia acidinfaciens]
MRKKHFVLTDQSGFTLIESIFSIVVLTILMSLLPLMYNSLSAIDRSISLEEDFEWNIFLIQLRDELGTVDSCRFGTERVYLIKNTISIKYERFQWDIRRQVGDKGHEVVLQNVRKFDVKDEAHMLVINVEFINGTKEEARFIMPAREEGEIFSTKEAPFYPLH